MAPTTPALDGCCVALSGTFPGFSQSALQKQITGLGGLTSSSVTKDTTHLITIQADYDKPSTKVKAAKDQGTHIVGLEWLQDCLSSSAKEDETKYLFNAPSASTHTAPVVAANSAAAQAPKAPQANGSSAPQAKPSRGRKRAASPPPPTSPSSPAPQAKKKKGATNSKSADDTTNSKPTKSDPEPVIGEGQVAKSRNIRVPLDEGCPNVNNSVYIDDDGVIYDASLNQTNASNNNNKFYRVQVHVRPFPSPPLFPPRLLRPSNHVVGHEPYGNLPNLD